MKNEEKNRIIEEALNLVNDAISKGVSKYRIANDTSINETTIGNYANGKTKPSFANAKILIKYFNSFEIFDNGDTITAKNSYASQAKNVDSKNNFGSIGGNNRSTYNNVGNTSNEDTEFLKQKIELLELRLKEKDDIIQAKNETIETKNEIIENLKAKIK